MQFAPANCPNGWTIQGDCVTKDYYQPYGGTKQYFNQRCDSSWTITGIRQAATVIGCGLAGTVCGPAATVCSIACSGLVGIAQAKCLDERAINAMVNLSFKKTSYVCCDKCNFWYKLLRKCP